MSTRLEFRVNSGVRIHNHRAEFDVARSRPCRAKFTPSRKLLVGHIDTLFRSCGKKSPEICEQYHGIFHRYKLKLIELFMFVLIMSGDCR